MNVLIPVAATMLCLAPWHAALATQDVALRYAGRQGDEAWQLRVAGTQVVALDGKGLQRWSLSPSDGEATDCDGVTQLALLAEDLDADGRIDATQGERARLVITSSWRHGAGWESAVLTLDASRPAPPRRLWRRDSRRLPSLARLVAAPAIAAIGGATGRRDFVVMLGAGLPTPATPTHKARSGAALLWLDAEDGHDRGPDMAALPAGVSGAVTALDLDRDGCADRLYVGDAVATLWRFDIARATNGSTRLAGGPLARLAVPAEPAARSIIAAPDVSRDGAAFVLAVGTAWTGNGAAPVHQGLFILRDTHPFETLTQAQYDALPIATPSNLQGGQVIDTGSDSLLARALTANGVLLYTQVQGDALADCAPSGTLRVKASTSPLPITVDGSNSAVAPGAERPLRRSDGRPASAFDDATPLLAEVPALRRLTRRYWRREDAD